MNKKLICYFSASGVTKSIANRLAVLINADLFEIEPVDKYSDEDLDWTNKQSRSTTEMNDKTFRPPVKGKADNINEYDTIILGFPVWWYTAPTIINTFIEENDLSNKNVYVFVTSGGSGSEGSFKDLVSTYSNINFINHKRLKGNETDNEFTNWIK